jgi:hypothetical protein
MPSTPVHFDGFADPLCFKCKDILQLLGQSGIFNGYQEHYKNHTDLLRSARSGCYICYHVALDFGNKDIGDAFVGSSMFSITTPIYSVLLKIVDRDSRSLISLVSFKAEILEDGEFISGPSILPRSRPQPPAYKCHFESVAVSECLTIIT